MLNINKTILVNTVLFNETEFLIGFMCLSFLSSSIRNTDIVEFKNEKCIDLDQYEKLCKIFVEKIQIKLRDCSCVIFYSTISTVSRTIEISRKIKSSNKDIKIICVGPNIGNIPRSRLSFADEYIDLIISINEINSLKKYLNELNIEVKWPEQQKIFSPELLKTNWNKFSIKYHNNSLPLIASIGCLYNCSFCDYREYFGSSYRCFNPGDIIKLIKYNIQQVSIRNFKFIDSSLTSYPYLKDLCTSIINDELNIRWSCFGRVNEIDEELCFLMARSGCEKVILGIESGSNQMLKNCNKSGVNTEKIKEAVSILKKYKIDAEGSFIIGIPNETEEETMRTIEFASSLKLKRYYWHTYFPKLHDILKFNINHVYQKLIDLEMIYSTDIPNNLWDELVKRHKEFIYHRHALVNIEDKEILNGLPWSEVFTIPVNKYIGNLNDVQKLR